MKRKTFFTVLLSFFLFTGAAGLTGQVNPLVVGEIYSFQTSHCENNGCIITAVEPGKALRIFNDPADLEATRFKAVAPLDPNVPTMDIEYGLISLESVKYPGHYLALGPPSAPPYDRGNNILLAKFIDDAQFKTKATFRVRQGFAGENILGDKTGSDALISLSVTNPGRDAWVKNIRGFLYTGTPGQPRYTPLVTWRVKPLKNNALHFDGQDDYVEIPGAALDKGSAITIEFWSYITEIRSAFVFFAKGLQHPERIGCHAPWGDGRLYWDYGDITRQVNLGNGRINVAYGQGNIGKWTHIALVSEGAGGNFKAIYLNGVQVYSQANSHAPTIVAKGLILGGAYYSGKYTFFHRGALDDFRIWNRRLSAAEIADSAARKYPGNQNGLLCWYKFDEGIPGGNNAGKTVLRDWGPNGWNGTLNGFSLQGSTSNWIKR